MKQIKKTKKQESGRSMIEMVGVLAVMGLITAGAFVLISSAMSSQRISRVDDDVSAIVQGVRLLYNSNNTFSGLTNAALTVLSFKDVKNPFGGDYKVQTGDTSSTVQKDARFKVIVSGLGTSNAATMQARKWPSGGSAKCGSVDKNGKFTEQDKCSSSSTAVAIEFGKDDSIAL